MVLFVAVALAFVLAAGTIFARLSQTQVATSAQTRDTATQVGDLPRRASAAVRRRLRRDGRPQNIGNCNPNGNDIRAHNIYVQDWAEQGIFTLLAYLAVGLTMLWEAVRRRKVDDPGNRADAHRRRVQHPRVVACSWASTRRRTTST